MLYTGSGLKGANIANGVKMKISRVMNAKNTDKVYFRTCEISDIFLFYFILFFYFYECFLFFLLFWIRKQSTEIGWTSKTSHRVFLTSKSPDIDVILSKMGQYFTNPSVTNRAATQGQFINGLQLDFPSRPVTVTRTKSALLFTHSRREKRTGFMPFPREFAFWNVK